MASNNNYEGVVKSSCLNPLPKIWPNNQTPELVLDAILSQAYQCSSPPLFWINEDYVVVVGGTIVGWSSSSNNNDDDDDNVIL